MKVWGCLAKVAIPPPKKVKIGPKTVNCVFIGYTNNSAAYHFLVYKSDILEIHVNTIIESRNASFFEDVFPYKRTQENKTTKRAHEDLSSDPRMDKKEQIKPRKSKWTKVSTTYGPDFLTYLLGNKPQTFKEAMLSSEAPFWKEAINNEIESIMQNHTWELVDLPQGHKPLGSKWIFKRKMKADGSIDKYKAQLVIKRYKQKEGLDYFDTYSPVTRIISI